MTNNYLNAAALLLASTAVTAEVIRPTGSTAGQVRWQEQGNRSDDFESGSLNPSIWQNAPASLNVGAWTFDPSNAYVSNGRLVIETTQETHTRAFQDSCWDGVAGGSSQTVQRQLFYKSGAVRTSAEGVYGFYEAKIKGVEMFPGLSPAFWLYSDGHPFGDRNQPGQYVDYSEIDIVELQQADWRSPTDVDDQFDMDHNLHARVEENGQIVWKRPKQNPDQLLHYRAPFDPRLGFHTYAVENRPDRITWYVDGKEVGSQVNKWWHRPMHMIFSQGLRRQLIKYNAACQRADPNPDNVVSAGFPNQARMQVEYVKVWKAQPSVWIEQPNQYQSTSYSNTGSMDVTVSYHGGSDYFVSNDTYNGITLNLIEKNANGLVRVVKSVNDASTTTDAKKYAGDTELTINLSGVTPTAQLPSGHFYALAPVFKSSNGSIIYAQSAVADIKITGSNTGNVSVTGVNLTPANTSLSVGSTKQLNASVSPSNASDKSVYYYVDDTRVASVNNGGLVTAKKQGTTRVTVTTNDGTFTDFTNVTVTANTTTPPAESGIEDASFESGNLNRWNKSWGNVSVVSNNAKSGSKAVYLNGSGGAVQIIAVEPNTTYTLKGWGKVSAKGQNVQMMAKDFGGSNRTIKFTSTAYTQKSLTFTTGSNNTTAKIIFASGNKAFKSWGDDFSITKQ
ncbi:Ig-like domain-containing protein [Echinimonas agarilytica]|uniref:Ig-like domain-containing protein n=1 Tax=Echinimonas agarilytica TaxID=1215918 RepID=A0AA41W7C1_9GAMM|nr:Ig-like domain-containing protein [Echinimonas agarilytica]MCM2680299.1 Ig-like domain-containing protein [Echinimonas agarilytica]